MVSQITMGVSSGLVGILVIFAVYYWKKFRANHYWKTMNVPGETPLPFAGNSLEVFFSKVDFFKIEQLQYQKYGRIFGMYLGSKPQLFLAEPEHLRNVLVKDFHIFPDRVPLKSSNKMVNSFVSVSEGETWKRIRSVITPAFASGKIKKMMKLMVECSETTCSNLMKVTEQSGQTDCKTMFGGFTMNVIASTAFGTKLNSVEDTDNIFVQNVKKVFNQEVSWRFMVFFLCPKLADFFKISFFNQDIMDFFSDLTLSIVERRKQSNEVRDDLLQTMLEAQRRGNITDNLELKNDRNEANHRAVEHEDEDETDENYSFFKEYAKNKSISTDEFIAQCVLFFMVGYDTTATTLAMTVYYLALNQECQKKVLQEVDQIWTKHATIDHEAINEMKYTAAVISETLRMAPPATRTDRNTVEDYVLGDTGITIKKGTLVSVPIYAMHFDPEFFPNPEQFDPERFLPENKDLIQPYTYLPFGAGPRNCLGMRFALSEVKMCLLHVFRKFTFDVCPDTLIPMQSRRTGLYQPKSVELKVLKRNV